MNTPTTTCDLGPLFWSLRTGSTVEVQFTRNAGPRDLYQFTVYRTCFPDRVYLRLDGEPCGPTSRRNSVYTLDNDGGEIRFTFDAQAAQVEKAVKL